MKRTMASLRLASPSVLATISRTVWPRTRAESVARATMRIWLASISFSPNGGEAQPPDVDLISHDRREGRSRIAGRHRLCGQLELVDEGAHDRFASRSLALRTRWCGRWCPAAF